MLKIRRWVITLGIHDEEKGPGKLNPPKTHGKYERSREPASNISYEFVWLDSRANERGMVKSSRLNSSIG